MDSTETGGSSYVAHVGPRGGGDRGRQVPRGADHAGRHAAHGGAPPGGAGRAAGPESAFESALRADHRRSMYALAARRHMHEFGTTSAQLAAIKVAAVAARAVQPERDAPQPGHRRGGARLAGDQRPAAPAGLLRDQRRRRRPGRGRPRGRAKACARQSVKVLGHGEAPKHQGSRIDLTHTGAVWSGPRAFEEAGVTPRRHRLRVDLRLVHDHRARDDRGPRVLREGQGRRVRGRRGAARAARRAAVQHRRRRPVQQPPGATGAG